MQTRVVLALCGAAAAIAFGCRETDTASGSEPPRIEVKATVAPIDAVAVVAPIEGHVTRVAVAEGAVVRKGDLLLTLENASVDRDLAYAHAQVAADERRLRAMHVAPPLPSADGEKASAEILRNKEAKLVRYKQLFTTGDVARQDVQDVETEVAAARREWLAERERRQAAPPSSDPALIEAELDRARADQKLAEYRKSLLTIVAPANGLAHVRVHEGDDVFTRDPLAEVRDASSVRVQAQVAPELLRFVRAGQTVDVKVMTIPPRSFREPIASVSEPGADGGAAIAVKVPNPDRMMQPGTPAVITVQ